MGATTFARQADLVRTAREWRLWTHLSWRDVRQRYRGSVLGPLWIAGSVLVVTLGAGSLYASLLDVRVAELLPYISLSFSLWLFVSLTIVEGCHAFFGAALVIRNTALPLGTHVMRAVSRNLIVLAHSLPVVAGVFLFYRYPPGPAWPLSLLGLVLLVVNVTWMAWIAALVSTRFRDAGQLIGFALQFAIFVTPIFWAPAQAGERHVVLALNPFHHLLIVARGPLLGENVTAQNWSVAAGLALVGSALALWAHGRFRNDVVHWV